MITLVIGALALTGVVVWRQLVVMRENERLVVRNNLQRKTQVMDSTGIGLENIRARYQILTGADVEVIVSPQFFTVLLPDAKLTFVAQTQKG